MVIFDNIQLFLQELIGAYYMQLIIMVGINTIMATSLNLILGYTGQLSIGHAWSHFILVFPLSFRCCAAVFSPLFLA